MNNQPTMTDKEIMDALWDMNCSVRFVCDGMRGTVDHYGFVSYGGAGFQVHAASSDLKAIICKAIASRNS